MASVVSSSMSSGMSSGVRDFDVNTFITKVITRFDISQLIELEPIQIENYVEMMFLEYKMYHGDGFTDYINVFNTVINTFTLMLTNMGKSHTDTDTDTDIDVVQKKIDSFIEFRNREIESKAYYKTDTEMRKSVNSESTSDPRNELLKSRCKGRTERAREIYTELLKMYEELRLSTSKYIYVG